MEEDRTEEQTAEVETSEEEQVSADTALAERLAKLEEEGKQTKSYLTKLEQENATYRQIITERGEKQTVPIANTQVSDFDKDIESLEQQFEDGDITSEELSRKTLKLVKKSRLELEKMYYADKERDEKLAQQKQEIQREYSSIFEDSDLKGLDKEMGNDAWSFFSQAMNEKKTPKQAAKYAQEQTKAKIEALRVRFGGGKAEPVKTVVEKGSGFSGEGEGSKKVIKKETPITAEESQKSFIEMRRQSLAK